MFCDKFNIVNDTIDQYLKDGIVYNTDFNLIKSDINSRILANDINDIHEKFTYYRKYLERSPMENLVIEALNSVITQFPSKKLLKALDKLIKSDENNQVAMSVNELIRKWKPVAEKVNTLKSMIEKGRKPSNNSTTVERTLDNTGTCPCCGKNVKLSNGLIVAHGYNIYYGCQSNMCFGVNHKPIEVSSEGAVAYRDLLQNMCDQKTKLIADVKLKRPTLVKYNKVGDIIEKTKNTDDDYIGKFEIHCHSIENDIKHLEKDIKLFNHVIEKWKPTPLPTA